MGFALRCGTGFPLSSGGDWMWSRRQATAFHRPFKGRNSAVEPVAFGDQHAKDLVDRHGINRNIVILAFRCAAMAAWIRRIVMTICYVDESGTDTTLPVAVVAGLLFDHQGAFWLDVEWAKILARHGISAMHMREFRPRDVCSGNAAGLFVDIVHAIRVHKLLSAAATLTADQYRESFKGVTKWSMYGACFCNLTLLMGVGLDKHGPHRWPLSFVLDDGNPYKQDIIEGKPVTLAMFPRVASIDFRSDKSVSLLQAADVLSWAVRRDLSGKGFPAWAEPLKGLFDGQHLNFNYEAGWMKDVAQKLRDAEAGMANG
jgi:hypothetical protein